MVKSLGEAFLPLWYCVREHADVYITRFTTLDFIREASERKHPDAFEKVGKCFKKNYPITNGTSIEKRDEAMKLMEFNLTNTQKASSPFSYDRIGKH